MLGVPMGTQVLDTCDRLGRARKGRVKGAYRQPNQFLISVPCILTMHKSARFVFKDTMKHEESLIEEALEPTQEESEEVKACGQPVDPNSIYTREHDFLISRTTGYTNEVKFGPQPGNLVPKNPFASKAQQKFMFAAEARGDIKKGTAERWAKHTPDIKSLPERKKKSKKSKKG